MDDNYEAPWNQQCWFSFLYVTGKLGHPPLGIPSLQAEKVEIIVIADQCITHDRIERVNNVLPDGLAPGLRRVISHAGVVVEDHAALGGGHARCFPGEPFGTYQRPM